MDLNLSFTRAAPVRVEEGLFPNKSIYLSLDYSKKNGKPITLDATEAGEARMCIPDTGSYAPVEVCLGKIHEPLKRYPESQLRADASAFLKTDIRPTILHFLQLSPFCLSELAREENVLDNRQGVFTNLLILYRLSEIFLSAIEMLGEDATEKHGQFRVATILLLRQRYLYLAQMPGAMETSDKNKLKLNQWVPGYSILIRRARQAYAQVLLNDEETALLAFSETSSDALWDLDREAQLLICSFRRKPQTTQLEVSPAAWQFARETMADHVLTDTLLRNWFLAHDNLGGLSFCMRALYHGQGPVEHRAVNLFANWILLNIAGLALFFAGFYFPGYPWLPLGGILLGLALPLVLIAIIFFSKKPLSARQALYPLALRVPAMGLVGVLAIAGLMDPLVRYTLHAFDPSLRASAIFIIFAASAAAFAYIFFEVQTRTLVLKKTFRQALSLFARAVVSSLWLAVVTGWLVDPIGVSRCGPEDIEYGAKCLLVASYGRVFDFSRAVSLFGWRISLDYVIVVGAIALLVGVFTQIFWEDKAIAEPL